VGAPLGDRKRRIPLAAVALPLLLPGCVVPVALSAASAGFDGLTYIATGKAPSDHVISELADQNCSTWRIVVGRAICRDYTPEERHDTQLARARLERRDPAEGNVREPTYAGLREPPVALAQASGVQAGEGGGVQDAAPAQSAAAQPRATGLPAADRHDADMTGQESAPDLGADRPVDAVPLASQAMDSTERHGYAAPAVPRPAAAPATTESAASEPEVALNRGTSSTALPAVAAFGPGAARPAAARAAGRATANVTLAPATPAHTVYLVLASFASRANAERALGKFGDDHPEIAATNVRGAALYRIVAGPFRADELMAARARVERAYGINSAWRLPICQSEGASNCVDRGPSVGAAAQLAALPSDG
jgi:sporulation related protein